MSVNGVSSSGGLTPADWQNRFAQVRSDFQALGQALQSGDLAGAQQSFAALLNDRSTATSAVASNDSSSNPMAALSKALQSGDLAGAQQAFAALRAHRGHHHHGMHGAASTAATPAADGSGTDASSSGSLNVLA